MTLAELALLALVGVAAGTVNTIAGGGSFLTLAAMLALGIPPGVANATNRVGVFVQSGTASAKFQLAGVMRWPGLLGGALAAAVGGLLGAWVSVELPEDVFTKLIGVVMLGFVPVLALRPKRWLEGADGIPSWALIPALFVLGLYGGLLQAGVGVFLLAALVLLGGDDLVRANARKSVVVAVMTLPALALFVWQGLVEWLPALILAAGSALGGWIGAKLSISRGAGFIRWVVIAVVLVSGIRLLL